MFKRLLHKMRLSKVVRELPFYLGRDVGPNRYYEPSIIKKIYAKYCFHGGYLKYAFALFSNEVGFFVEFPSLSKGEYYKYRNEISHEFLHKKEEITFSDLMKITKFKHCVHRSDEVLDDKEDDYNWSFSNANRDGAGLDGSAGL